MSALDDFAKNTLQLNNDQQDALKSVETILGMIPQISGYVSTGMTVLTALGVLKAPVDPLQQAVKALADAFNAAFETADIHTLMLDIGTVMGHADTAMQVLGEKTSDELQAIRDNHDSPAFNTLDTESLYPIQTFEGANSEGYWQRFFFQGGVFHDPFFPESGFPPYQPRDVLGGLVFDFRLTLPAYLRALTIRMTVAAAIFKDFPGNPGLKSEFANSAQFLQDKFNKIRGAIWEYEGIPFEDQRDYEKWLYKGGGQFGAVEVYSTFHVIDAWPYNENWDLYGLPVEEWYTKFLVRHKIRTMVRWKSVYSQIGLPHIAAIIAQLNLLASGSPTPVDAPTEDWSLREIAGALNAIPNSGFTLPSDNTVSLKAVLRALQTFNAPPYSSLRAALAQ